MCECTGNETAVCGTHVGLGHGGRVRAADARAARQQRHDAAGRQHRGAEVGREGQRLAHHPRAEDQRLRHPNKIIVQ